MGSDALDELDALGVDALGVAAESFDTFLLTEIPMMTTRITPALMASLVSLSRVCR
jgi:hypothetical protein